MRLYQSFLTKNRCYKTGQYIRPKGIMVHSTGANNPNLRRYVQSEDLSLQSMIGLNRNHNDWNRSDISACVHAFIGKLEDGSVATIQTLPWAMRGWHAGTGTSGKSANDTHISFEICEDALVDEDYFQKTYREAVELVAMLCTKFDLDPAKDGVVICHQDGYRRGIASNHGDIYNWWPKHGHNMENFRQDVLIEMYKEDDDMVYYKTFDDVPDYYRHAVKKVMDAGALQGTGNAEINVSEDLCRTLTILDRMGKL